MKQRVLFGLVALLFVISGCSSNDDLVGNWSKSQSDFSGSARYGAVSFTIDNKVYVGLGQDDTYQFDNFKQYSSAGWKDVATFIGPKRKFAVAFTATKGGKTYGYVGTGYNKEESHSQLKDFYEFDPRATTDGKIGSWTKIDDLPGKAREQAIAFSINGVGYVGTGYVNSEDGNGGHLNDYYKLKEGAWTVLSSEGRKMKGATAFVIGDNAYICTGASNNGSMPKMIAYNGKTGTWNLELNNLNDIDIYNHDNMLRTNAVSFVLDGKGYIATGNGNRSVWEYNTTNDRWTEKTNLETEFASRYGAVSFVINKKAYISTGKSTYPLGDVWNFDPNTNVNSRDNY